MPHLIYASIPGPELVEEAIKLGIGATIDDRFSKPVLLEGTIIVIEHGGIHAETEVIVRIGSILVIITKKRKPYHKVTDFTNVGLDPKVADIVVVKIDYLVPELYDMRKGWVMALTPCGVDLDLERLGYRKIKRPMCPLDMDIEAPDLSARLIPLSHESLSKIKNGRYYYHCSIG